MPPKSKKSRPFSSIPVAVSIGNVKNSQSSYLRSSSQFHLANKPTEGVRPDPVKNFEDVIIIHPGSHYFRIGLASQPVPREVPQCLARRIQPPADSSVHPPKRVRLNPGSTSDHPDDATVTATDGDPADDDIDQKDLDAIESHLKQKMKANKIRLVLNASLTLAAYNSQSAPVTIEDHNDPYKIEWIHLESDSECVVGTKALQVAPAPNVQLFYPISKGTFNTSQYGSMRACLSDLSRIWTYGIETELAVPRKDFGSYSVVVVVPDVHSKLLLKEWIAMLLGDMGFRSAIAVQESICGGFGAGISLACVVDIGAETTKVNCIEDGMCIGATSKSLCYGGQDVSSFLAALLKRRDCPYRELDLNQSILDRVLVNDLKERFCTLIETNVSMSLCEFYVRQPHRPTLWYSMKMYLDSIVAPMYLFYPGVLRSKSTAVSSKEASFMRWDADHMVPNDTEPDEPPTVVVTAAEPEVPGGEAGAGTLPSDSASTNGATSANLEASESASNMPTPSLQSLSKPPTPPLEPDSAAANALEPLDEAIAGSLIAYSKYISAATSKEKDVEERLQRISQNVLLLGGGSLVAGLDLVLQDRIRDHLELRGGCVLPSGQSLIPTQVQIVLRPREIDSRDVIWKGASILSKLESANDMWVGPEEWEWLGLKKCCVFKWLLGWD
ncbi:uncharacterized protein BJ171DRAFT_498642 [Polychytrium aggregatum]|uniref:uncharacterized protein n=1 Tax=Polychytrium aggregatum TaxID=110093 RepID=UPI0022FE756A|nr:uncharacterized protein BJ171DRAFT_498642 [Polychytrium aggregatum]KAI9206077.1 hypothetical protein BJ171DRAFT_498642 [Polychytrium aggregatum]